MPQMTLSSDAIVSAWNYRYIDTLPFLNPFLPRAKRLHRWWIFANAIDASKMMLPCLDAAGFDTCTIRRGF